MIDKAWLNTRTILMVFFAIMASGCSIDRPLKQSTERHIKQPVPNQVSAKAYSTKANSKPLQCSDKKIAILHIGMEHPEQGQHFPQLQKLITQRLLQQSQLDRTQYFRDATHIALQSQHISLLGRVDEDMKSQIYEIGQQFDSQIVMNGSISKIEESQSFTRDQSGEDHYLDNISGVIKNVGDKLSARSWRKVFFKLQLFDSFSGELLVETETEHKISIKSGELPLLLSSFSDHEKEQQEMLDTIDTLVNKQIKTINDTTFCIPLRGRIIATDNIMATINIGSKSQVRVGDKFDLIQLRLLHTDAKGFEHLAEEKVGTLDITQVQTDSATGKIENLSRTTEIRIGDLIIGR